MTTTTRARSSSLVRPRSLRHRAWLIALAVALLPPLAVVVAQPIEQGLQSRMEARVLAAAHEAASADGDDELRVVALRHGIRLRVADVATGAVTFDEDRDSRSWLSGLSDVVLAEPNAPTVDDVERALPPIAERPESSAESGPRAVCRTATSHKLLVCAAAARNARGDVVYATVSSRRALAALYDQRYQLVKLSLILTPFAILLGLYLGWRIVRPVEELKRQVQRGAPTALDRDDEFGDLSRAFADLTQKLVDKSHANERFVADLAHEMKNPIAAIRAASEVVDDGSERGARLGRILGDASKRLDALVVALLELARAEAGVGLAQDELTDVDLRELVMNVVNARPDASRIAVTSTFGADSEARVRGSVRHLESVVRNLLDNASAFGERVDVRIARSRLGERAAVELVVDDDGPGIPPNVMPRVFDRFFTTRGERQGTGLGLALVKAIVEAHGGSVRVEAPAKLIVTLPAQAA